MKVIICAVAKKEHKYINDWVKYYLGIGVDTIYLYDNDNIDEKSIISCIDNEYISSYKVVVIDIRGKKEKHLQQHIYNDFYNRMKYTFDWCMFLDIDEYLFGVNDINKLLSGIKYNVEQVRIKWKLFGDDNLIMRDTSVPVYKAFHKELHKSLHRNLKQSGNLQEQGKCILRGGLQNIVITSPHFGSRHTRNGDLISVFPSGKHTFGSQVVINGDYSKETVWLHHYMTKTLAEFIEQKLNRNDCVYNKNINLDYYWRINEKTKEKLDYLKEKGLI